MYIKSLGANKNELVMNNDTTILFSYSTPVAAFIPGKGYFKTAEKFSVTTSKHITQWLDGAKAEVKPQEWFNELAK